MISNYLVHYSLGKRCSLLPWTNFNATVRKQIAGARLFGATATTNQWLGWTFGNSFRDFEAKTFQSKSEFEDFKSGDFIYYFHIYFPLFPKLLDVFGKFPNQRVQIEGKPMDSQDIWSRRGEPCHGFARHMESREGAMLLTRTSPLTPLSNRGAMAKVRIQIGLSRVINSSGDSKGFNKIYGQVQQDSENIDLRTNYLIQYWSLNKLFG